MCVFVCGGGKCDVLFHVYMRYVYFVWECVWCVCGLCVLCVCIVFSVDVSRMQC